MMTTSSQMESQQTAPMSLERAGRCPMIDPSKLKANLTVCCTSNSMVLFSFLYKYALFINEALIIHAFRISHSCTHGGGDIECDDKIQSEATKPTSCGMITDPNGGTHIHSNLHLKHFDNVVTDQIHKTFKRLYQNLKFLLYFS